jgi:antirestriction protein
MSRIYVASLLDYNCGTLHGAWFEVDGLDAVSLGAEIQLMLDKSPHAAMGDGIAEEFAIHDSEGFGGADIGEYTSLEFVVRLAELVEEHGAPFAVFVDNIWTRHVDTVDELDDIESAFIDAWIGNMSAEDYAYEYVTDCLEISGTALDYFDFERFARDMQLGGDITEYYESGEFYLFHNN